MTEVELLLTQIDQAYDRRSWHGTNLKGSIRGMTPEDAAWRPGPGRHSVQELVVHAAYWKYAVRRRLTGEGRGSFPLKGSDWFARPSAHGKQWREDVALLERMHRELRVVVSALDSRQLQRRARGAAQTPLFMVSGIVAHDLYHAGQIQLLKRLREAGS